MAYNNYMYAVDRSDEYLAHYGVKGMKWGVRKAVERGDRMALGRHYAKAQKKLAKLSARAEGKGIAGRRAAIGAASSALLSGGTTYALNRLRGVDPINSAKTAGLAAAAGGIGGGLLNAGRATPMEKSRAKMQRDQWSRDMRDAFKGTEYAKKIRVTGKGYSNGKSGVGIHVGPNSGKGLYVGTPSYINNIKNTRTDAATARKADEFVKGMNKSASKGGLAGALTVGGGAIGAGIAAARYIKKNPEGYEAYKAMRGVKTNRQSSSSSSQPPLEGLAKLGNRFEGHYQQGLSRGMSHDQAEAYANGKLNGPPRKRKR